MKRRRGPIVVVYRGNGVYVALPRFVPSCDAEHLVDEEYRVEMVVDRSMPFHKAYFAQVNEAFKNLAEQYTQPDADHPRGKFPNVEHLRKWALVETGYCKESTFAMEMKADAIALAVAIRKRDEYAVIIVRGNVVRVFDALSQSVPEMDDATFKQSAQAVLDLVSGMARTTPAELKKNAGRSA